MANVLFLVHRLPYPPDKGDKVRSFHLLKHLTARHRVFLGTFVDDPRDERHVDAVRAMCAGSHVARLRPLGARLASLAALVRGEALTLRYYGDAGLASWVASICGRERVDATLVFSSSMAKFAPARADIPLFVDFVDVDSAKWTQYADVRSWPLSWLYRREGRLLLAYERAVAARARRSVFVTRSEADLFRKLAPECASSIDVLSNGVDSDFFSPDPGRESPFTADREPPDATTEGPQLVFTGAMDYWPNVDAVTWFAREVLPELAKRHPAARFHIVGRNPSSAVRALESKAVVVTGTVADVRPYLQHATVVVAPLRVARGVQNKVLEAMAMTAPVVASRACAQAIGVEVGRELLTATTPAEYVAAIDGLLADSMRARAIGHAARSRVVHDYGWAEQLARLDALLGAVAQPELCS